MVDAADQPRAVRDALGEVVETVAETSNGMDDLVGKMAEDKDGLRRAINNVRDELKRELENLGLAMLHMNANPSKKKDVQLGGEAGIPNKCLLEPGESFRKWSTELKAYCNGIAKGFTKKALHGLSHLRKLLTRLP